MMVRLVLVCALAVLALNVSASNLAMSHDTIMVLKLPSMNVLFSTNTVYEGGLGEDFLAKDVSARRFYTINPRRSDCRRTLIRCYSYDDGLLWSSELPFFLMGDAWCADRRLFIGINKRLNDRVVDFEGMGMSKGTGGVVCVDLDAAELKPKFVIPQNSNGEDCKGVFPIGTDRILCAFGPIETTGLSECTSSVVYDTKLGKIISRRTYDGNTRQELFMRRKKSRYYDPGEYFLNMSEGFEFYDDHSRVATKKPDGCEFYDGNLRLVSKVSAAEIGERLGATSGCRIVASDKAMFWNCSTGHWFSFDIRQGKVVDSGKVGLRAGKEMLYEAVADNLFDVRIERSVISQMFSLDSSVHRYELLEIRNGKEYRRKYPKGCIGFIRLGVDEYFAIMR